MSGPTPQPAGSRAHHPYEGLDIQLDYAERMLGNLAQVWSASVHLQTHLTSDHHAIHDGKQMEKTKGHTFGEVM